MKREKKTLLKEATDRRVRVMSSKCRTAWRTNWFQLKPETNLALMLCLVFYLYVCLGGAIFLLLEGNGGLQHTYSKEEEKILKTLNNSFNADQIKAITSYCEKSSGTEKFKEPHYKNLWNFMEATDFAYQVITGQGTGQTTRLLHTTGGKTSYIFFVVLGLPLTILTIRATGQTLNIFLYATIRLINVNLFKRRITSNIHSKALVFNIAVFMTNLLTGMAIFSTTQKWDLLESMFYTVSIVFTISNSGEKLVNKDIKINSDKDKCLRVLFNTYTFLSYTILSSLAWSAHHFTRHMRFKAQNKQQATRGCPWVEVTRSQSESPGKTTREREIDRESVC